MRSHIAGRSCAGVKYTHACSPWQRCPLSGEEGVALVRGRPLQQPSRRHVPLYQLCRAAQHFSPRSLWCGDVGSARPMKAS